MWQSGGGPLGEGMDGGRRRIRQRRSRALYTEKIVCAKALREQGVRHMKESEGVLVL